ncbi:MAG: lipocalin family protein [Bacteroidales bacterium]
MEIRKLIYLLIIMIMATLFSCSTIPKGVVAITPFESERYLGKWYEIARIDFKYEKDLNNVTAHYSLNEDGTIKVDNRGFNTVTKEWSQAIGKAKFAKDENIAMLKVSFFGPFYSGYNVIAIDPDYRYALIGGSKFKYLWILSREADIPKEVEDIYLKMAKEAGYHVQDLLWIEHSKK